MKRLACFILAAFSSAALPPAVQAHELMIANGFRSPQPHYMLPRGAARLRRFTGPLVYHNGPVLQNPRVYVVYWGWTKDPSGEQTYLQNFLIGLGESSWLNTVTQYYGNGQGNIINPFDQFVGVWSDNGSPLPNQPTDAQIQAEANRAANHFGGANSNANYFIATPTGHSSSGFPSQYCAYHGYTGTVAYTNFPYQTDSVNCYENALGDKRDGISIVAGHEYAEAITDPQLNAWFTNDSPGQEIADLCQGANFQRLVFDTGDFATQGLWSNASGSCVQGYLFRPNH